MANVLSLLKPTAQPSMNGFDLSQKHVYSSAAGRLDCPVQIETVPRDKFKIDVASLMRTMTFQTAAFLRGKVTFDFYFVPYSQLWHPFNQFIGQRKDVHSSNQKGIKFCPVISLYKLLNLAYLIYKTYHEHPTTSTGGYFLDVHGYSWSINLFRMLDFFGYGNYLHLQAVMMDPDTTDEIWESAISEYEGKYVNVFRPAAYQHAWYDMYRNKFYDNYEYQENQFLSDYVLSFNFDDLACDTFGNSILPIHDSAEDLTDSENLRVIMLFTQRYCQYKQDLFQSALPSTQFGVVSSVEIDLDAVDVTTTLSGAPEVGAIDLTAGSITFSSNASSVRSPSGETPVNGDLKNLSGVAWVDGVSNVQIRTSHSHDVGGTIAIGRGSLSASSNATTTPGSFDVLTLRRAEALQKWRQNALRAGNMVDDSFRAHYGATPRYESDNNVLKLGSFEGILKVNSVEATAATDGSVNGQVGDLGATGTSVIQGKPFNFECSDFGVIICLQYFRPESEYSSTMLDKANRLYEPFDFFTPEFQNMGLDTINMVDYSNNLLAQNQVLGYAAQYWWYKQAVDKVHGEFAKFLYKFDSLGQTSKFVGNTDMWVAPRNLDFFSDRAGGYHRNVSSLYVNPNVLDTVFAVNYDDGIIQGEDDESRHGYDGMSDHVHFNTYFDIKAIRPMSVVGLPNF